MQINVTEEELIYIVAAVGRVHNPPNLELYERLHSTLVIGEQHTAERLGNEMRFSNSYWLSTNRQPQGFTGRDT